ncbi:hypothetical protein B0O80DRAFT_431191 [Mortierella sp. GBAus27b]|nr:hypothetical protein B0O80DRAFT_431191 [Mortierella sp. GBAus27b]
MVKNRKDGSDELSQLTCSSFSVSMPAHLVIASQPSAWSIKLMAFSIRSIQCACDSGMPQSYYQDAFISLIHLCWKQRSKLHLTTGGATKHSNHMNSNSNHNTNTMSASQTSAHIGNDDTATSTSCRRQVAEGTKQMRLETSSPQLLYIPPNDTRSSLLILAFTTYCVDTAAPLVQETSQLNLYAGSRTHADTSSPGSLVIS